MKIIHKTIADDPEKILETPGPSARWGGAQDTVQFWAQKKDANGKAAPVSGTHIVTGHNGMTVCTQDLCRFIGWHANQANNLSWGHEIKEVNGGGVHRQALLAAVEITLVDTLTIGVQQQCPTHYKNGVPYPRFVNGGKDLVGVFGHRDVTTDRGYWDPGDTIFKLLVERGFESFDFYAKQDLDVWAKRQEWLKGLGFYKGIIDGVAGYDTTMALKAAGFPNGIFARWRDCAELPPMPPGWTRP